MKTTTAERRARTAAAIERARAIEPEQADAMPVAPVPVAVSVKVVDYEIGPRGESRPVAVIADPLIPVPRERA